MGQKAIQQADKICLVCGKAFNRSRYNGTLEDNTRFRMRKYCSLRCMGKAKLKSDPTRDAYRKRIRHLRKPTCEQCGTMEKLSIHHIDLNWSNNDSANIQTLCSRCHLLLHHRYAGGRRLETVQRN